MRKQASRANGARRDDMSTGVEGLEPIRELQGVLTGTPRYLGAHGPLMGEEETRHG